MTDIPRCPHQQPCYHDDAQSYVYAEHEAERTGIPSEHPLPPYCQCCGGPCPLGYRYCDPCQPKPRVVSMSGIKTAKALHFLKTGERIDDATARALLQRDSPEDYD